MSVSSVGLQADTAIEARDGEVRAQPTSSETTPYLLARMAWLVRLRWIAVVGVAVVVGIAWAVDVVDTVGRLLAATGVLAGANLVFHRAAKRLPQTTPVSKIHNILFGQILVDLTILTVLVQLSGNTENPFVLFYVFHMGIAAMLLPYRKAMLLGGAAAVLRGGAVLAELTGMATHHPLGLVAHAVSAEGALWVSPSFVVAYLVAFSLTELGVIYFVHALVSRLREAESIRRERELVAKSRERLARIGTVATGVAHTIRNPLHGIGNCIDLLRDHVSSDGVDLLDMMAEGTERIELVTKRLLTLARDEPLRMESTDLATLLQEAHGFALTRRENRRVPVHFELATIEPVHVDQVRLTEAIVNALDNAVYACREEGEIVIRLSDLRPERQLLRIEIEDTGEGMSPDVMERAHEPFFTTKPVGEGTGLGLAISRRILEEHGGTFEITTRAAKGCRVRMEIPIR